MAAMNRDDIPALSFSEEKFRGLFQSSQDAILLADLATQVVVDANPAASRLLQRPVVDLIGLRQQEIFPQLPEDYLQQAMVHSGEEQSGQWETEVAGNQGQRIPVSLSISFFSLDRWELMLTVCRDVSRRKAAEETLRIQSEALRHAGDVILIADLAGEIRFANSACERILSLPVDELVGKPWQNLQQVIQNKEAFQEMITTVGQGQSWRSRVIGQSTEGEYVLDVAVTPLLAETGLVERLLLVGRDSLKEVRLEQQLLKAQKLEAIGTMAGGIAHDFNNILFAILGRVELAMDRLTEEDPLWSHLREIRISGQRAQDLVKQLLAFSRAHKGERTPISLVETVQESLEMLRTTLPAAIRVETRFAEDAPAVLADATQICQVMINLGSNAVFAMGSEGGVMEVVVDRVVLPEEEEAFPGSGLPSGRYAMLSVRDTGCGIQEDYLGLIFDPFFTTKPIGKGTGLGLSVVHGVVSHHGGAVTVQSMAGEGSLFRVFLPESPVALHLPPSVETPLPRGSERVLVVDDDRLVAAVLEAYLTNLGYRVVAKTNVVEAWHAFEDHPDNFDLVIADRAMPGMNGVLFLQKALDVRSTIHTLLLMGCDDLGHQEDDGGFIRLHKPFSKKELAVTVRNCLAGIH
ncbi:MAG: PAS domain S-box protein [Magnetococcales bacterium]|nr:PAS domain S-box protein [Magnetococcales bacterium]